MKILGLDPGYDRLGVALLSGSPSQQMYEYSECFTPEKGEFEDRLVAVGLHLKELLTEHKPDCVALETLFVTKNQKTAMHVSELRGVLLYEARLAGLKVVEYTPSQIKAAVTGYGASDKTAVSQMLGRLLQIPNRKMLDDEFDAIAVALTALVSRK